MGSVGIVALRMGNGGCKALLQVFIFFTMTCASLAHAADGNAACGNPVARIVSIQGIVEVQTIGQTTWTRVTRLDTPICDGDRLRTGPASRSALFVQPESLVRIDRNTTISVSQLPEETLVEFFQQDLRPAASNSCGAGYFISRFPRKLKVNTPKLSAAVEGTEFLVALNCELDQVSVFEGKVRVSQLTDASASVLLQSGQTATAGPGEAPAIKLNIKPEDAVQWVVYYPPLTPPDAKFEEDCRNVASDQRAACLIARAERLLRAGHVDEAKSQINDAVAVAPMSSDAKALQSIIHLVRNEKNDALRVAQEAVDANPRSSSAWLALSYAQQADFKLEAALSSAQKAIEIAPNNALALSRVAELQLSLGWNREAEKTAQKAVEANNAESRAHMILGFVHLAQIKVKEARENFERAIELDSTEPLSRLGLGLAIIRKGQLQLGREQIEIAVALDPTNSLLRSYVGKAYYEENTKERDGLAAQQFELAKQLDPKDPTPWFYEAILKNSQNQPVEAYLDLQGSIVANDHRFVNRSRLLLDEDVATRKANISALYQDLGFQKLAVRESTNGLAHDAGSYSAHRLLAQAYSSAPRHDIARVSEALQSQIRKPLSLPEVDPILSNDNLTVLRESGGFRSAWNEYTSLFGRDQSRFSVNAEFGNLDTVQSQVSAEVVHEALAFSLSNFHYETDGFSENGQAQKDVSEFFLHVQPSHATSVQLDLKSSDLSSGVTFFAFDPLLTQRNIISDAGYSARLSGRIASHPFSDWILTAAVDHGTRLAMDAPTEFVFNETDIETSSFEVQNLTRLHAFQVVSGAGYTSRDERFILYDSTLYSQGSNAYVYGYWTPASSLSVTLGVSAEQYRVRSPGAAPPFERSNVSPKVGLIWMPTTSTALRAGAFSALRRPLLQSQTIEPTQIAGFNQFFTGFEQFYGDIEGTLSDRWGVALDQTVTKSTFAGLEVSRRELQVPLFPMEDETWRESTAHAYLYQVFYRESKNSRALEAGLSVDVDYEHIERPQVFTGPEGIMHLDTIIAPLALRLFHGDVVIQAAANYVEQKGEFSVDVSQPIFDKKETEWIMDASLQYRFPRRAGSVTVGARNIFDKAVSLVETDPFNPRIAKQRYLYARLNVLF